jgi:hypothetical protein
MQRESLSEREEKDLSDGNVVPPFFLLGMDAFAFMPLADMVEVEGKQACINGLEVVTLMEVSRLCDRHSLMAISGDSDGSSVLSHAKIRPITRRNQAHYQAKSDR